MTRAVATPAPGRIAALDGLRGVAVLMVVAMHFYARVPTPDGSLAHLVLRSACNLGFAGVDLFFVLSGYFIGGILLDHRTSPSLLPAFYLRRGLRILPLYALLLASFFVCREIRGLTSLEGGAYFWSPIADWNYFTFTQNIAAAAQRTIGNYWLGPTWSLAVEEQFYLLMPFFVRGLDRRQLVRLCLCGLVLSPALRIAALAFAQNGLAAVFLLPMRADGLLCGVLCALVVRDPAALDTVRRLRRPLVGFLAGGLVIFAALSVGGFETYSWQIAPLGYSLFAVFFSGVLLHLVAFPSSRLAGIFRFGPLAAVGLISYFVYLFHAPVWYFLHWYCFNAAPVHFTWAAGGVTALALALTLLLGAASWRYLESPLLRLARKFSYG
ncbi:MAG: acyltransferase [Verrucomicrobia bacterium]|nr:acyltransferase [Verrucomicrobiota bacterium]